MPTILAERIDRHDLTVLAARVERYYRRHDLRSDTLSLYREEIAEYGTPAARTMVRLINDRPVDSYDPDYKRHDHNITAILRRATGSKQATGLCYDTAHPYLPQLCWYRED